MPARDARASAHTFADSWHGLIPVSTVSGIRASAILATCAALAALVAAALMYPLALDAWQEASEARNFTVADASTQTHIVRTYLIRELHRAAQISPKGTDALEPIFFDRRTAVLRSEDASEPWEKHEIRSADREGAIVDRARHQFPIPLQELLDRTTRTQSYNADPDVAGVTYVATSHEMPTFGVSGSCNDTLRPRLIRISRAVMDESGGLAIALVATTFCDASTGMEVVGFTRDGATWRLLEQGQARS